MAMASRTVVQVNPPSAVCAKCRTLRPASSNFCGECGTRLGAAPSLKPARCTSRRATVLFCDVVGYTAMSERLDPEDVFAIIGRALGVVAGGDADGIAVYAVVDDPSVAALGWRYERTDGVEVPDGF